MWDRGLVLWLPFAGDVATDRSGEGNNGALSNASYVDMSRFGRGVSVSGSMSSYVSVANSATIAITGAQAFSCTINLNAVASDQVVAFKGAITGSAPRITFTPELVLYVHSNGELALRLYDVGMAAYIGRRGGTIAATTDTEIGFTYDGSNTSAGIKLFAGGLRVDTANEESGVFTGRLTAATALLLGAGGVGSSNAGIPMAGKIGRIRMYEVEKSISDMGRMRYGLATMSS